MRQDKHDTRQILALRLFQKCRSSIAILESLVPNRKFLDKRFIHYVSELKRVDSTSFGVSNRSSAYENKMNELDKDFDEEHLKVENAILLIAEIKEDLVYAIDNIKPMEGNELDTT